MRAENRDRSRSRMAKSLVVTRDEIWIDLSSAALIIRSREKYLIYSFSGFNNHMF